MSNPLEDVKHFKRVDVSAERLARVYAESLLASAGNETDGVSEELQELVTVAFTKEPNLYPFLASGTIATSVKSEFFEKNFRGNASDAFVNFLQVVNHHGRLNIIQSIAASLSNLLNEKKKRVPAFVKSAVPLDDQQRQSLKQQLNDLFQKEPVLEEQIDPELLGGFIVRVGDWQFDGTVKARLNQLKNQLLERSTHEIQGRRDRFCTV